MDDHEDAGALPRTRKKPSKRKPVSAAARARVERKAPAQRAKPTKPTRPATATTRRFELDLQIRHAQWVEDMAHQHRTTPDKIIEQVVRAAYAQDPTKGGRVGGGSLTRTEFVERSRRGEAVTNQTVQAAGDDGEDDD